MGYQSSGDTGSGETGINLGAHVTGDPIPSGASGLVSSGHTWLIVVLALGILWALGAGMFKSVRM